ncbi:uncharacterized protein LY89DRAFT_37435 [Mollisia scopiformis]|uniref:CENP-V/GFA domain-containing protein n=1 Tax=Mollisia scopiformis TaxID=149040 RepID=A0A194XEA3_MOLSC|nr:uncharacterized protein LY89DRAFT_37435 [Mollisia scopiformis]KUJ18092.1 hypothetical protein LY89DRAFT_37435 [Mollisia scopiformis]
MKSSRSSLTLVDNKPPALTGSCMCGKVTYSSSVLPSDLVNCHCQTCRRLSGAPFLTFGQFPVSAITWTSATGANAMKKMTYSDIADRTHCAECGSPISMTYKCEPEAISITAGTFDEESIRGQLPRLKSHIFVEEKVKNEWYELPPNDGVPKYSGFPSVFSKKIEEWKKVLKSPGLG